MAIPWAAIAEGAGSAANTVAQIVSGVQSTKHEDWRADHAHQIEMEDYQRAGLNPILAGSQGGASVNEPAVYRGDSPMKGFASNVTQSSATASENALRRKTAELTDAQTAKTKQEQQNIYVDTLSKNILAAAQADVYSAQAANQNADTALKNTQLPIAAAMIKKTLQETNLSTAEQSNILEEAYKKHMENVPLQGNAGTVIEWIKQIKSLLPDVNIPIITPLKIGKKIGQTIRIKK